jgi:hypothetical protein
MGLFPFVIKRPAGSGWDDPVDELQENQEQTKGDDDVIEGWVFH